MFLRVRSRLAPQFCRPTDRSGGSFPYAFTISNNPVISNAHTHFITNSSSITYTHACPHTHARPLGGALLSVRSPFDCAGSGSWPMGLS